MIWNLALFRSSCFSVQRSAPPKMPGYCRRFCRWFCAPDDVNVVAASLLASICCLLFGTMCALFNGVIMDNRVILENPMYVLLNDLDSLTTDLDANVCGHQLLKDYKWLRTIKMLISSNCSLMPDNLRYLRYTSYIYATYNTLFMHLLLSGTFPVSFVLCLPIAMSFISANINPINIGWLGLFEFTQGLLSWSIFLTYMYRQYKKSKQPTTTDPHKLI